MDRTTRKGYWRFVACAAWVLVALACLLVFTSLSGADEVPDAGQPVEVVSDAQPLPDGQEPPVVEDAGENEGSEDDGVEGSESGEDPDGQQPEEEAAESEEPETGEAAEAEDGGDSDEGTDATYSLRLLVKVDEDSLRDEDVVLGERGGVYLLGFEDEEALEQAEEHYWQVAAWCERDIPVSASEGEVLDGLAPVGEDDNALALLEEAEAGEAAPAANEAAAGRLLVALVDTGAPADEAVVGAVSVIGEDAADWSGHAGLVLDAMKGQNPDIQVLSVKALDDSGSGSASSVYAAIEYAIGAGVDIINLSLAGAASYGNAAIADAVNDALAAGIVVVAAAGNGGADASLFTPANVPGVVTVGACYEDGTLLEGSNRGEAVDFYAVADSTSLAAARVTGWLSANGAAEGWRELLLETDWAFTAAEDTDPGENTDPEGEGSDTEGSEGGNDDGQGSEGEGSDEPDTGDSVPDGVLAAADYVHTLNDNGGSGGSGAVYSNSSAGAYLDASYTRKMTTSSNPVAVPTRGDGYVFQGYCSTSTGTTRRISYQGYIWTNGSATGSAGFSANNTWYARWSRCILDDNGGSGGNGYIYPVNGTGVYRNVALTQSMSSSSNPVTVPTRGDGYVFQGYYVNKTSTGAQRIDSSGYYKGANTTFAIGSDTTLYARWVRITLNDTGGTGGNDRLYWVDGVGAYRDASLSQKMTTTSNALPIPTKPGYVFQGYFTASSGGTKRVNANGTIASNSTSTWNYYDGDVTLYAQWKVAPWRITLDKQGGTGGQNEIWEMNSVGIFHDQDMNTKVNSSNPVSLPSKPYQTFMGYYKQQYVAGGQCITNSGTINANNFGNNTFKYDATIYAGWKGIKVTLNMPNGNRNGGPSVIYEMYNENWNTNQYGSTPITSISVPTRTQYTFMGFYTGQNGSGTQIIDENGNFVVPNTYFRSDTTIYCYWAPENYVVTLDPQGADISVGTPKLWTVYNQGVYTDIQFTNAVSTTVPITIPQRAGYVFQGYFNVPQTSYTSTRGTRYINANGTLTGYLTKSNKKNMTLYAQWKVSPHTVTLDKQGGTGGTNEVYEMASVGVALDWDMTKKISYSGNSGRKNPVTAPTKPYQTFNGYYTQQYGRGTRLLTAAGYHVNGFSGSYFPGDATIYAYWTGFRITLNRQSGTGGPNYIYSFYNEKFTSDEHGEPANIITSITTPRRTYYTFMGYYTQKDGAGTQVIDGDGNIVAPTTFFTSTATLYAYWLPENYVITLDNNGADPGSEGSSAVYTLYGSGVYSEQSFTNIMNSTTNPIVLPVKTGYVFRGYRTGEDSQGNGSGTIRIDDDGYVKFNGTTYHVNTTLHARWLPEPFTISLDDQGGGGGSGAVYELYTDGVYRDFACKKLMSSSAYPVAVPTKADRVFAGYWTEPNGGGTIKINERGYRQSFVNTFFTSDDTIYAFWRGYAIKLDDQRGRGGSGTIYEHYGQDFYSDMRETTPIGSVAVPTRSNYVFQGYYTGTGGSGVRLIDENGNYESVMTNTYFTADTTVYAYWTPAVYTIELDSQSADAGLEGTPEVYEQYSVGVFNDAPLANTMTTTLNPITVPQKQFSKFGGYYTQPGGSGTKRIDANGYKTSYLTSTTYQADATLYAYWAPLTITLDDQGGSGGSGAIYEEYGQGFYRNMNLTGQIMNTGGSIVALPRMFNHVFKGYYTQPGGAGVCVIDANRHLASTADPTMFTDDATIYAYWEFHLDLPLTGGSGDTYPLLPLALCVVLMGAVAIFHRSFTQAAPAVAPAAAPVRRTAPVRRAANHAAPRHQAPTRRRKPKRRTDRR